MSSFAFPGKYPGQSQSLTLLRDWTTATSMVVLALCARVRSGASAQLSGALSGRDQYASQYRDFNIKNVNY